jgi:hypothetical protein
VEIVEPKFKKDELAQLKEYLKSGRAPWEYIIDATGGKWKIGWNMVLRKHNPRNGKFTYVVVHPDNIEEFAHD